MKLVLTLVKRAAQLFLLAIAVTLVTFLMSSLIPGDFFTAQQLDPTIRPETLEQLRRSYGLDQPVLERYARWLWKFLHLDLGYSLFYRTAVITVVREALIRTLWLGIPALILGLGGGIAIGTLHGMYRNRLPGRLLDLASTVALSLPSLVLGLGALILASRSHWFPIGSMSSSQLQDPRFWEWLLDRVHHLVLPVTCLTVPVLASVERIQCAATGAFHQDLHIRSARSRGLGRRRIFIHYVLRPALNPILSTSGPMIGGVLSGSLVLEVIFSWPGLGQVTYDALFNHDLFLLVGCVVGSAVLLVAGNLVADILLLALDPRTRASFPGART